jgi:hypothetical protein
MNSPTVGMSGNASERAALVTARVRSFPDIRDSHRYWTKCDLHLSPEQIGQEAAAIGDMNQVDAGHHLKQFPGDMA